MAHLTSSLAEHPDFQKLQPQFVRMDQRIEDQIRGIRITPHYTMHAEGSVLIEVGNTKVICTASVEDGVPHFLKGKGQGWLTAEYSMLPRATVVRTNRESSQGKVGGRTHEIQRLIGRSLRQLFDIKTFGERTVKVDCDVIQADGGTRTASITGGTVAIVLALRKLHESKKLRKIPTFQQVAAISVGLVDGRALLDLTYEEDSRADVDMNVVMLGNGSLIEVQGTGEHGSFTRQQMNQLLDSAEKGLRSCFQAQLDALGGTLS